MDGRGVRPAKSAPVGAERRPAGARGRSNVAAASWPGVVRAQMLAAGARGAALTLRTAVGNCTTASYVPVRPPDQNAWDAWVTDLVGCLTAVRMPL